MKIGIAVPMKAYLFTLLTLCVLPAAIGTITLAGEGQKLRGETKNLIKIIIGIPVLAGAWLVVGMHRSAVTISNNSLEISGPFPKQKYSLSNLSVDSIHDYPSAQNELTVRTLGISMPGYQCGWFRLKNSKKAFAILGSDRSCLIQESNGNNIIIGLPKAKLENALLVIGSAST